MSCEGLTGTELQLCRAANAAEQAAAAAAALKEDRSAVDTLSTLADALATIALPAILAVVLWRLWPVIKTIFENRKFTVKLAGFELSAQDATDQLRKQLDDLQAEVTALREGRGRSWGALAEMGGRRMGHAGAIITQAPPVPRRILWVDDNPENNAVLIAGLRDAEIECETVLSTEEALATLKTGPERFLAVISDQGRVENGKFRVEAGSELVRLIADAGIELPVAIYTSGRGLRTAASALDAGAHLVTESPTELRRFIAARLAGSDADELL